MLEGIFLILNIFLEFDMIRKSRKNDINSIMAIWLESNIEAHDFIPEQYWKSNYMDVKESIKDAEVIVYEENEEVIGFIGIVEDYIAGLFVRADMRSKGIGEQLIDEVKKNHSTLSLDVFLENMMAVKLYMREEFKVTDKKKNKDTGFDEYHMEWKNL